MTSKQEKLAAARRKLKEFQGKSKEVENSKQKNIYDINQLKISNDQYNLKESVSGSSPLFASNENSNNSFRHIQESQVTQHFNRDIPDKNTSERKISENSQNTGNFSKSQLEYKNVNPDLVSSSSPTMVQEENLESSESDFTNRLKSNAIELSGKNNFDNKSCSNSMIVDKNMGLLEKNSSYGDNHKTVCPNKNSNSAWMEAKTFFDSDFGNKNAFNETIASLESELQSHAQTIAILVQQRNDAQTALVEMQSSLNQKLEENEALNQQVSHLTSSVNSLTQKVFEMEAIVSKLEQEKKVNLEKWSETRSATDNLQVQLDRKKEEYQEMKRKYEEKNNDCQQLLTSLKEVQAQLSFYQIQLQQYSKEETSGPATQLSNLQNENINLRQKIEELERKLKVESSEKEESSQGFHIYAQQCNSQLSSLNSQLKSLILEKENLSKENMILSKKLNELESAKEKNSPKTSFETEIADLHEQISALSEENKKLIINMKEGEEERDCLKSEIEEKNLKLKELSGAVKELTDENKKLERDAETPKADERLLAAMESDKIAAAKAVSQNQKLKMQVVELEQAFMKVNDEKLELTNQLAHEKHVTAELQNLLQKFESENHDHHHHHHHHTECQHSDDKKQEMLVNDSNEVEELRNIVRQLQDDKMELTARLNFYESNKKSETEDGKKMDDEEKKKENGEECEDTKLLLQQMKEKVRKTMNEIAILDEEKEKLEHLVLQLQGETETIGEYVTLYQKQRMILRQRAQEKDNQLMQLSRDRDELKSKLTALDELVQVLLAEREGPRAQSGSKIHVVNSSAELPDNTAGKIRALINEIGSATLIDNPSLALEHCFCCSGRLITI